jgi:hypothetical protein
MIEVCISEPQISIAKMDELRRNVVHIATVLSLKQSEQPMLARGCAFDQIPIVGSVIPCLKDHRHDQTNFNNLEKLVLVLTYLDRSNVETTLAAVNEFQAPSVLAKMATEYAKNNDASIMLSRVVDCTQYIVTQKETQGLVSETALIEPFDTLLVLQKCRYISALNAIR